MNKKNKKDESSQFTKILVIISLVVVTVALYFLVTTPSTKKPPPRGTEEHAKSQGLAEIGGDFVLTDHNGEKFDSNSLRGKPALVYFGFTFCPDVCPNTLTKLTEVMEVMDKYQIDVGAVFITVDPARDNAALMKQYMSNFHKKIIGLTGSEKDLKAAADAFKVYYEFEKSSAEGRNDYMINHTSFVYLLDRKGHYVKHFDLNTSAEAIIEFIRINFK